VGIPPSSPPVEVEPSAVEQVETVFEVENLVLQAQLRILSVVRTHRPTSHQARSTCPPDRAKPPQIDSNRQNFKKLGPQLPHSLQH